jgi:D-alanyl-D-alanine carboxypeptidase
MLLKRLLPAAVLILLVASAGSLEARTAPSYKGAIATDAMTGAVLIQDNADIISPPASMTKLMTYAVLCDYLKDGTLSLDTKVFVTREDARIADIGDSTKVWLRQGEVFPVDELIYAMMIQSANDAAYALAHKAAGTVDAFVARMNVKAKELGMDHSTFRSPNGFPPRSRRISEGDLTTPRDFAVLCRYLLLNTDVLRYTSVKTRTFAAGVRLKPVLMTNHNHLLGRIQGVDGLKTGFTSGAGFCLSATVLRGGHRIIVVTMDSPDQRTRDLNVSELMNEAFIKFPITEGPFARAGAAAPAPAGAKNQPTRPSPTPTPEEGPVIHLPGH